MLLSAGRDEPANDLFRVYKLVVFKLLLAGYIVTLKRVEKMQESDKIVQFLNSFKNGVNQAIGFQSGLKAFARLYRYIICHLL